MHNGNGIDHGGTSSGAHARASARDALGAVSLAERAIAQRVLTDQEKLASARGATMNAFGGEVAVELVRDPSALAARAAEVASNGERVAIVASARALAAARDGLRAIAARRLGVVAHAVGDLDAAGYADALALGDLGWGVLFASSAVESLDLALVARRAAEDSGCPFVVVHERAAVRHVEPVAPPSRDLCEAFVGAPQARVRRASDPAHAVHAALGARAFAERVPFALGSALRELGALTGRQHDVIERAPASDAAIALVGVGAVGDSLVAEVERLRASGHDVGAVKIVALRPFPGARVVKALSRALVVTVLERGGVPLAQSNPLAAEIKAAFADALTWAPDYPGIGRIPRVVSGVVGADGHELDASDLDAVVHNAIADERGRRHFALGAGDLDAPPPAPHHEASLPTFTMRGRVAELDTAIVCADLCVAVLGSALGLHAGATVRPLAALEGGGFAVDVAAGRRRPRGTHAPHTVRFVALDDAATLVASNPIARLARGGTLAVPSAQRSAEGVWSELPAWAKAVAFDRRARVVAYEPTGAGPSSEWRRAAAFAGMALAAAAERADERVTRAERAIDPSLVAREVAEAVRAALPDAHDADAIATAAAEIARRAFEAHVEVPRSTIERDEDTVRLGRRDARAGASR